jgi:UDP-N-acetylmuramate dehydrogenase
MSLYHRFEQNKHLSSLSTFGIGGPCRYFLEISSIEEMQEVLCHCHAEGLPYIVIGKGSNILFDDRGFNGLVIQNNSVSVGGGYSFALLGVQTARKGWSGLEFASGIPASVGGAIFMNAGANGAEVSHCLKEVTFVNELGDLAHLPKSELSFAYRTSSFQNKRGAIVGALFELSLSPDARQQQLKIIDYRTQTQPYGEKSAGCVFRNPSSESAGSLIQKCGLKGLSVGDAEVSLLHGNFIVNKGEATAKHVLTLVEKIRETVKQKTGIDLEMEIRTIPYDLSR